LDPIVERISGDILRLLPGVVRDLFGTQIRAVIEPMLQTIKRKIDTVRDVTTALPFTVVYHDPPDRQPDPVPPPVPPTPPNPFPPTGQTRIMVQGLGIDVTLTSATATCSSPPGTPFALHAQQGGWSLDVTIAGWQGFPSPPRLITYPVIPGGADPLVVVNG